MRNICPIKIYDFEGIYLIHLVQRALNYLLYVDQGHKLILYYISQIYFLIDHRL